MPAAAELLRTDVRRALFLLGEGRWTRVDRPTGRRPRAAVQLSKYRGDAGPVGLDVLGLLAAAGYVAPGRALPGGAWRCCLGCGDGLQLLRALELVRPSVIVLHVRMPRLEGHGVLERLREDPLLRAVPVVATSAQAEAAPLLAAVCQAFVPKPFDLADMVGAVRGALT